ncbi:MAG: MlaD family protein [Thermodesulfobacteriota bacterium]|nr:MlaD family protein [Thermodesulfobacteriota bacterium]
MQSSSDSRKDLVKAGATLFIGLVTLGLFIVALGGTRFWESLDSYVVRFRTIKDLNVGRPVKFAGLDVGRVLELEVDKKNPALVRVIIGVDSSFTLYQGTRASISQKGLVGDNYVLLSLDEPTNEKLLPGAEIPAVASPGMAEIADKVGEMVGTIVPKLTRIAGTLEEFVNSENSRNLRQALVQAPKLLTEARTAMARINKDWVSLSSAATQGVDQASQSMREVSSGLGRTLVKIESVLNDVNQSWNSTLDVIRAETARTGRNVNDLAVQIQNDLDYDQERLEQMLDNMADMAEEMKMLSRSLRERPWRVLNAPKGRPAE